MRLTCSGWRAGTPLSCATGAQAVGVVGRKANLTRHRAGGARIPTDLEAVRSVLSCNHKWFSGHPDETPTRDLANLGPGAVRTFFEVWTPLSLSGVLSGFIPSFVAVIFITFAGWKMLTSRVLTGIREQISPTILAVATILVFVSERLRMVVWFLRRRSRWLRGMSPG
ncbi:hypothetical protein G5B40_04570 [Pikeienuella piscinae]|uniref:ABC transmembrane type-1 domain-containing protein n=1 Tax=Pikeienuella piscinae TaxID=2748098 RepID=A0A7L5BYU7_9RHOB|nr:hypothetical protein [Pikeienuella piscinae]QIE54779.1 hypothetical protein G5B40_04570 [Pikeienuella piscinae]